MKRLIKKAAAPCAETVDSPITSPLMTKKTSTPAAPTKTPGLGPYDDAW